MLFHSTVLCVLQPRDTPLPQPTPKHLAVFTEDPWAIQVCEVRTQSTTLRLPLASPHHCSAWAPASGWSVHSRISSPHLYTRTLRLGPVAARLAISTLLGNVRIQYNLYGPLHLPRSIGSPNFILMYVCVVSVCVCVFD